MNTFDLLNCLEYSESSNFLTGPQINEYSGYSHTFRLAKEKCGLHGVYTLKAFNSEKPLSQGIHPVIYVCRAASEKEASRFHKLIWNQNVVPFFLVETPKFFRLYSGFRFDARKSTEKDQSILKVAKTANEVLSKLSDFSSTSIDNGKIWTRWGNEIRPESRVDRKLLKSLKLLSNWLRNNNIPSNTAHALIGKYVYLHYLKDRDILSVRKLKQWGIDEDTVFGRTATLKGFTSVVKNLDRWLNGTVFPIPDGESIKLGSDHISMIAGTFSGDNPQTGQMHLDFKAYDFQHISIETLSMVYQQFLHSEGKGRGKGAFYTPVHLVNFILDELETKVPLAKGMKVLDPACGSGAFLVQCYRRIIERERNASQETVLSPFHLKGILTDLIHGVDVDEEACGVTELSLILTLLDYVDPPDLEKPAYKKFTLPPLRNKNVFHCPKGFFDTSTNWYSAKPVKGYDWIIGNPPWKKINTKKLEKGDKEAISWINKNKTRFPVSSNQLAEAFAWEVTQHLSAKGIVGMLMPAGSLFKTIGKKFRKNFFKTLNVWCVANFANLRHLLFQGAINPAAAFFYSASDETENSDGVIITHNPFALNQVTRLISTGKKRKKIWSIIVNANEIKEIPVSDVAGGSSLPWKLALWGSNRDRFLLLSISKKYPSLKEYIVQHELNMHPGLELRDSDANEPIEYLKEVVRKKELKMDVMNAYDEMFSIPHNALELVGPERAYVRKRSGLKPLKVCYPPHIIISAARKFAIFSDKFFIIPPRQIGISGSGSHRSILKALALYLNSDFVAYQQFMTSSYWGVERDRPDKTDLEGLPVPLDSLTSDELTSWERIYDELAEETNRLFSQLGDPFIQKDLKTQKCTDLKEKLNRVVNKLLGITKSEKWLINDMLSVRKEMNEGRCPDETIRVPNKKEIHNYASVLKKELDDFLNANIKDQHFVKVYYDKKSAIVKIYHTENPPAGPVELDAIKDSNIKREFEELKLNLLREKSQWVYFNHSLKIYERRTTYLVKPMQRILWLRSHALQDADEFIAEKITGTGIYH